MKDLCDAKESFTDQFHLDFNHFIKVGEENRCNDWTKQDLTDTHMFFAEAEKLLEKSKHLGQQNLSFSKAPNSFEDVEILKSKKARPYTPKKIKK